MAGYNENSDNQSDSDQTATGWIEKNPTLSALGGLAGVRAGSALAKYLYAAAKAGVGGLRGLASPGNLVATGAIGGLGQLLMHPKQSLYDTLVPHNIVTGQPSISPPQSQHVDMLGNPETAPAPAGPGPGALSSAMTYMNPALGAGPPVQSGGALSAPPATTGAPMNIAPPMSNGVPLAGLNPPATQSWQTSPGAPQAQNSQNLLQQFAKLLLGNAASYSGPGSQNFTGMY